MFDRADLNKIIIVIELSSTSYKKDHNCIKFTMMLCEYKNIGFSSYSKEKQNSVKYAIFCVNYT